MPRKISAARQKGDAAARKKKSGAAPAVDLGPLGGWIGFYLRMAQIASFQAFARRTREHDLNPGRFAALMVIGKNPDISQTVLSQAIGIDKSTLTPAIDDLARRGLVRRTRTDADKRAYRLRLTAAGEKILRELAACARAHDRDLDAIVGRQRPAVLRALKRIVDTLGG